MMTWLAWSAIALAVLVATVNAWMTWQRLAGASRRYTEMEDLEERSPGRRSKGECDEHSGVLAQLDERGYLSRRQLRPGYEAAICRTPLGARIVVGRSGLREPRYAWDYASVGQAQQALTRIALMIDPEKGVAPENPGSGSCPTEVPRDYLRRWKYTADGQMQRF